MEGLSGAGLSTLVKGSRIQTIVGAAGILGLIAMVLWVFIFPREPWFRHQGVRVHVTFSRLANLDVGAPVKVGTITVGFVKRIDWRPQKNHIRVTLYIDARFAKRIPSGSRIYQDGITPVGRRHIVFDPPDATQPLGRPLANGDELRGEDPFPVETLAASWIRVQARLEALVQQAPNLPDAWRRFSSVHGVWLQQEGIERLREIVTCASTLEFPGPWIQGFSFQLASLRQHARRMFVLFERFHVFVQEFETGLNLQQDPKIKIQLQSLRKRVQNLMELTTQLQKQTELLIQNMTTESGTLHAFMRDPSMYNDLRQMARRLKNAPLDLLLKRTERRKTPLPPSVNRNKENKIKDKKTAQ